MSKKTLTQVSGAVFILIGLLGFAMDPILGLFGIDTMHNIVHIGSGILAFFLAAKGEDGAALFGKIMTVVYGLVTVLGFLAPVGFIDPQMKLLGLMDINGADNFLHLLLTALFAYIGFFAAARSTRHATA
jgi:hypothetical protein